MSPIASRSRGHAERRSSARQRGYTTQWEKARTEFLRANPICARCSTYGHVTVATVVHHTVPHRGDVQIFWDRSKWQPLCKLHHNSDAQSIEKGGKARREVGLDGWPIE